jgi:riboflavin synthase
MEDLSIKDSISVDGCCQTIVQLDENSFEVLSIEETLSKTILGDYTIGENVNLERAMVAGQRLGGHFVQGHVDCYGVINSIENKDNSWNIWIEFPIEFSQLVIPVGSICINGVSLTTARIDGNKCMVSIIPYTYDVTNIKELKVNSKVNIEFDMLGKYMKKIVETRIDQ